MPELITPQNRQEREIKKHIQDREADELIIWTPSFIIFFSLVLVIGLSVASILTQGWLNGYYTAEALLLTESALLLGCWIALLISAHSAQIRLGAIFGSLWALSNGVSLLATLFKGDPAINGSMNVLYSCLLLGCYLYLSSQHTFPGSKDGWLVRGMLLAGGVIVLALYWFSPVHTLSTFGTAIATVGLYLCIGIWWLRPACWRSQPAPTFFFGMAPTILLLLSLPHKGEANFFFSQLILFCILLGVIRITQAERRTGAAQLRGEELPA